MSFAPRSSCTARNSAVPPTSPHPVPMITSESATNPPNMSFSKKQDPRVEKLISEALEGIRASLAASPHASSVRAVILGGGYGRGEGGATPDGMPYNDLDFFVVMKGVSASPALRTLLRDISAEWGAKLSLDVDFHCVDSLRALCKDADTLMIQELFAGSRVVFGDEKIFDGVPLLPFSELPWTEGARLLLNRGAGLLFARQRASDTRTQRRPVPGRFRAEEPP